AVVDRIWKYVSSFGYSSSRHIKKVPGIRSQVSAISKATRHPTPGTWHPIFLFSGACLRTLRSVLRTSLFAVGNSNRVERAADYVIAHSRQVFHAAAPNKDNRVLLQVVPDAGDVGCYLDAVCQANASDFAQS